MSKRHVLFLTLLYWAISGNGKAFGQKKIIDSTQVNAITINMANVYNKAIGQQSGLYNGPAYIPYKFRGKTNANFKDSTSFSNGIVNYDGVIYTNVPLFYDLNRQLLVSRLLNWVSAYSLLNDRVAEFDLFDHHFVRILADDKNKDIVTGFYDELYRNKLQLLVRRTKSIQDELGSGKIENVFISKNDHFLKKGNVYYNVNSQGKFFDALKDKKKELKQYLKDNKIKFGDNPDQAMVLLAGYYDHLTN